MKLWIPSIGDLITLSEDVVLLVPWESRNRKLLERLGAVPYKDTPVFLSKGTVLAIDRIYIRKGKSAYDSITFRVTSGPLAKNRFWVKLSEARKIDFEIGVVTYKKRYQLWNRYQDGGWTELDNEAFDVANDAIARAAVLSKDVTCYGMVEVRDQVKGPLPVITFPAGGF